MSVENRSLTRLVAVPCLALCLSATALLAGSAVSARSLVRASSVAPFHWETVASGPGEPTPDVQVSFMKDPLGNLHVFWPHRVSATDHQARERTFAAAGNSMSATTTVVRDGLAAIENVAGDATGGGVALEAWFGSSDGTPNGAGIRDEASQGNFAPPVWNSGALVLPGPWGVVAVAVPFKTPSYVPTVAYEANSSIRVHSFATGAGTATVSPVGGAGATDGSPNVISDGNRLFVGWCEFGGTAPGTYVQEFDQSNNTLIGSPVRAPSSTHCVLQQTVNQWTPLAARAGGGLFVAGTAVNSSSQLSQVWVWRMGSARAMTVANSATNHIAPEVIADPTGRLWVGWIQSVNGVSQLLARRSNLSATVWGATVHVAPPAGTQLGSFQGVAGSSRLDVIGEFTQPGGHSLRHTVMLPGLSVRKVSVRTLTGQRHRVVFQATDAGAPLSRVRVSAHGVSGSTDSRGLVTLTFKGTLHAVATRPGYVAGSV